jgi:anti-repressor protein
MDYINEMNNLVQNLKVFENEEFGPVRATTINNEPWFVGKDVVKELGYEISKSMSYTYYIKRYCSEDDIKKVNNCDAQLFGIKDAGRKGELLINEYALYDLVLDSPLPSAKQFRKWITHEVLPSIRKTGGYIPHDENMSDDEIMARALLVAQKTIEEKSKLLQQAKETIEDMKPKALVGECLEVSKDSILVRELAKILKQNGIDIGQNRLFEWLRDNGYLIKTGSDKNMPTQRAMNLKLFEVKHTNMICNGETKIRKTTMVTGKGINYFINKFVSLEVI